MMTAGIVIDAWKLKIFKKTLDAKGYKYSQHNGPITGCITLKVEIDCVHKFAPIFKQMDREAANSKLH